jgi:hypothetical protein
MPEPLPAEPCKTLAEALAALQARLQICATVPDVRELEGKPCWVEVDGNLIKFLRL